MWPRRPGSQSARATHPCREGDLAHTSPGGHRHMSGHRTARSAGDAHRSGRSVRHATAGPGRNRSLWCIMLGAAPARRACLLRRGRAGLSAACKEALDALLGRKAAAAIRMAAVCTAPTWVKNAAGSTIENGAATSAPGTAASRHLNASPAERRGTPGAPSPASPRLCHRCQRSAPNSPNPGRHPGRARQPLPKRRSSKPLPPRPLGQGHHP